MNKIILKIFLILLVAFVSLTTFVCATDINLYLPGTDSPTDNIDYSNNSEVPNNYEVPHNTDTTNQENNNVIDNTLNNNNSESEVLQPTGISSAQETSLGISSIINIIFIAVGVIIILLAIAILIRLNG